MNKPLAVIISDIHYNINTLPLADAAMRQAINKANELDVPLIVAGDLHDTKANLRGECINAMIETFKKCAEVPYVLVGNHCRINEKAPAHSLNFLQPYANIVDSPLWCESAAAWLLPYYHDPEECRSDIKDLRSNRLGGLFIMHQGIEGSHSGDYIQDKSAIRPEDVAGMRVISGHYHRRQTITLPYGGTWNYIGNPFTLNYAEASDPPKGFQVLMSDGSLEFVPTNLRKHQIFEGTMAGLEYDMPGLGLTDDLAWVEIKDKRENLMLSKTEIAKRLKFDIPFRLDLIPIDSKTTAPDPSLKLSQGPLLDSLIDSLGNTSDERKTRLKQTWKGLCE